MSTSAAPPTPNAILLSTRPCAVTLPPRHPLDLLRDTVCHSTSNVRPHQLTLGRQVRTYFTELADHKPYRIYRYTLTLLAFIFLIVWLAVVSRWYDGNGFTTLCVILYANFQLLIAYHKVGRKQCW